MHAYTQLNFKDLFDVVHLIFCTKWLSGDRVGYKKRLTEVV